MHVCYVGILYDAKVWGMNDSPAPRYNAIGGFSVLVPSRDEHTGASVFFFSGMMYLPLQIYPVMGLLGLMVVLF